MPRFAVAFLLLLAPALKMAASPTLPPVPVDGQPLGANVQRLQQALEYLGTPLPAELARALAGAAGARDAVRLQELLDTHVLFVISINPESRVKVARGPAPARLQQAGYTPVIAKVINESTATPRLRIASPQAGPVYAGVSKLSMERQAQQQLRENENTTRRTDRFLEVELFTSPPMTPNLSGLQVEYVIALIYADESGPREATIAFDIGQGTQDLGFRAEVPVLFEVKPAVPVRLRVMDFDGQPTTGRFLFLDAQGHVFPPQAKRLAPDFFFQKQIYRADGQTVLLPPGEFTLFSGRGPEYRWVSRKIHVPAAKEHAVSIRLERWVNPGAHGFFSGDHHIHAAGCAHYTLPTEGVEPADMFHQVKGEGLNVGSVLTWGPGFDHQHHYFEPTAAGVSEPFTVLKYDIEVSGFGSQALGHVCLLNLKEQIYPGANGSKDWPSWTVPVMRWVKQQGGVTGYAHSGSGLGIDPAAAARRMMAQLDANNDGKLDRREAVGGLLPEPFDTADLRRDGNQVEPGDGALTLAELTASHDRIADQLPNLGIPELNGVGAQEIFVTAALGLCDFISAMDTERIREWNCWYHLLNCGLPVALSGETDFPCMSSTRVGQGRVYVQLGRPERVDYAKWSKGLAAGRSYVSDGYAHALAFSVNGASSGEALNLNAPAPVTVKATLAFSAETPFETPYGGVIPVGGRRNVGDTRVLHETQASDAQFQSGRRIVELVMNGTVVARREIAADGKEHSVEFNVPVERSSWIALRQFPQLHTNPVRVLVGGRPIRVSRDSARWALACIDQLWSTRSRNIKSAERAEAELVYEQARSVYRKIASEAESN